MTYTTVEIMGTKVAIHSFNTIIVGSGAAGLNAADQLYSHGQPDIAVVTNGLNMGTSLNTGSDKQTYYRLTMSGNTPDSPGEMANDLYSGGSMDGDIAAVEAASSARCYFRLVEIGVPFPHNRFGEYVGYKTDHDPRQRATSAGPLTSRYMTESLLKQVRGKAIPIFEGYHAIGILTDPAGSRALGILTINEKGLKDPNTRYVAFNSTNIIYATGGPAGIYQASVYPESQVGATGIALEAGVKGKNLTEWQYGIASLKFRWNLSGTYQQVLPSYVSVDSKGIEREFLQDYFDTPGQMLDAIFLKGYQWPFDPSKTFNQGSSLIDLLVHQETVLKNRRVYLDYTRNPSWGSKNGELDFSLLGTEAYEYLQQSGAQFGTPIQRLAAMNQPAIELYSRNGIDLHSERLEIAVCAQHNNGGLAGDIWWESNLAHFFPIGEANGTHGVYRPGGSALNSGQVGSLRAAQFIAHNYQMAPPSIKNFVKETRRQMEEKLRLGHIFTSSMHGPGNVDQIRTNLGERMTQVGSHIRSLDEISRAADAALAELSSLPETTQLASLEDLPAAFQNRDLLLCQYIYLKAMANYIETGGGSRGSYLVHDLKGELPKEGLPDVFRLRPNDKRFSSRIQEVQFCDGQCHFQWRQTKPLPTGEQWFETVWKDYRDGTVFR
ncbi:MAG: FAD-binding protein [Firmicutes bacterium]|nr:FAD-binding protein [Bacillota bacterium]